MNTFRFKLFGKFYFEIGKANPIDIQGRKVQELLCYLIIFRNRPHPRETLAVTLWEENSSEQSKAYLRRTLWQLQQICGERVESYPPLLLVESDWVQLNPQISFWLDVNILEGAYKQVKGLPGEELDQQSVQLIHEATKLYSGHLLEGWYQPWCVCERERLQHIYLVMLDKLMRYCEVQGNLEAGIAYGRQILRCDQAREYTHRQLMRLLYFAQDRSGALRQYERCLSALREELDVKPTQRTQLLYQQIRQDAVGLPTHYRWDGGYMVRADQAQLRMAMVELAQVQKELDNLNRRVTNVSEIVTKLLVPKDKSRIAA